MGKSESVIIDKTNDLNEKMTISLTINGEVKTVTVAPTMRLVDLIRQELNYTGTKIACGIGRCGACSVQMDGRLVNACLVLAYQANGATITTIEGLSEGEKKLHIIQRAFLEEGGFQCGYCTPGMIMAVKSLLDENPNPTEAQIQEGLSGNLCRCTGYGGIMRAVKRAITEVHLVS